MQKTVDVLKNTILYDYVSGLFVDRHRKIGIVGKCRKHISARTRRRCAGSLFLRRHSATEEIFTRTVHFAISHKDICATKAHCAAGGIQNAVGDEDVDVAKARYAIVTGVKLTVFNGDILGGKSIKAVVTAVNLNVFHRDILAEKHVVRPVCAFFHTVSRKLYAFTIKEGYGMKDTSAGKGVIEGGAEWYEQADAFMLFVVGMTADQVNGISTDDSGYVLDETLKAKCTMKISAYQNAVAKALAK